jgi:hypothetical protein
MINDFDLIDFTVSRAIEAEIRRWIRRRPKRSAYASERSFTGALMSWAQDCPDEDSVERNQM